MLCAGNWMMVLRGAPQSITIVPLWSVSFEEQFYLLWPLVLRKASRKNICAIALCLLAVATLTRLILLHEHGGGDFIWYNTFARLDSIACGILLAVILHGRRTSRIGLPARVALLLLGATAWMAVGRYRGFLCPAPPASGGLPRYPP